MLVSISDAHEEGQKERAQGLQFTTTQEQRNPIAFMLRNCQEKPQFHNGAQIQRSQSTEGRRRPVPELLPLATALVPSLIHHQSLVPGFQQQTLQSLDRTLGSGRAGGCGAGVLKQIFFAREFHAVSSLFDAFERKSVFLILIS